MQGDDALNGDSREHPRLKVIICGGGIAGFSTALLLREDHDVIVLESSALNEEMGAAITLSMNASRLLRSSLARAGFDAVKARRVEAEKFQELDWKDLSILLEVDIEAVTQHYGQPWWYFSRQDVHTELKRAAVSRDGLSAPVQVELRAHVERVDLDTNTVYTKSGLSFQGDVIVGADGIHSVTGKSVFGMLLKTVSDGLSAYRFMIPTERIRTDPETARLVDSAKVIVIVGPDRRIVAYPCSSWETMNFVCIFPDDIERRHQWSTKASLSEMMRVFEDFHPSVLKMLSMARDAGVWQLKDREPLPTLVKKHFALIGDAAHAMGPHQGQGGCQAIEDAEALRIILKGATKNKIAERLQVFDKLRVERVRTVIENTREMAPKRNKATVSKHKSTQTYSDYHWSYSMTEEAVKIMEDHGYPIKLVSLETGEVSISRGQS